MCNQDDTHPPLPKVENEDLNLENAAPPTSPPAGEGANQHDGADAHETGNLKPETTGAPPLSPSFGDRVGKGERVDEKAKLPGLCHHRMESGYYCQSPAVRDRHFCYSHLRLRGQRIRMARSIARGIPYRFDLPALDDLYAVQAAVEHVARALAAGLMKREDAKDLLWALQQSASNHRNLALTRIFAGAAGAPPLSPDAGDRVGVDAISSSRSIACANAGVSM